MGGCPACGSDSCLPPGKHRAPPASLSAPRILTSCSLQLRLQNLRWQCAGLWSGSQGEIKKMNGPLWGVVFGSYGRFPHMPLTLVNLASVGSFPLVDAPSWICGNELQLLNLGVLRTGVSVAAGLHHHSLLWAVPWSLRASGPHLLPFTITAAVDLLTVSIHLPAFSRRSHTVTRHLTNMFRLPWAAQLSGPAASVNS